MSKETYKWDVACYGIGLCNDLGVEVPADHNTAEDAGTVVFNLTKDNMNFSFQMVCPACAKACFEKALATGWKLHIEQREVPKLKLGTAMREIPLKEEDRDYATL